MKGIPSKNYWISLSIILLVSIFLRSYVSYELYHNDSFVTSPSAQTDNHTYIEYANEILNGEYPYFVRGFTYQPFIYAIYLPFLFLISGGSLIVLIAFQVIMGSMTVLFTAFTAQLIWGRRIALWAAVLTALSRMLIFYTPYTMIAPIQAFFMSLITLLLVYAYKKDRLQIWLVAAFTMGLANLSRGNIILMMVIFPLLYFYLEQKKRSYLGMKKRSFQLLLICILFYLPQLPFALINYKVHGEWVGASSAGDTVLAFGNTPEAAAGAVLYPEAYEKWIEVNNPEHEHYMPLKKNIFKWMITEPLAFFELKTRMFLLYWNKQEVPNNVVPYRLVDGEEVWDKSKLLSQFFLIDFALIAAFGLYAFGYLLCKLKKNKLIQIPMLTMMIYSASILIFYILTRFRLPIYPILSLFAAFGIFMFFSILRSNHRKKLFHMLYLVCCFIFTYMGYNIYQTGWESKVHNLVRPSGTQMDYYDLITIKDNGPQFLGGWTTLTEPKSQIDKKLSIAPYKGTYKDAKLKVSIYSEIPQQLQVQLNQQSPQAVALVSGINEILLNINQKVFDNPSYNINLTSSIPINWLMDSQRQYGRSAASNEVLSGEWVIELRLFKDEN
ncbi:MAG: glycosyltransferase family 39 protein [Lentisphaeria bacterium]|nr:glycosyltransferase family 39 protein [Lentisphaeria bacterium]